MEDEDDTVIMLQAVDEFEERSECDLRSMSTLTKRMDEVFKDLGSLQESQKSQVKEYKRLQSMQKELRDKRAFDEKQLKSIQTRLDDASQIVRLLKNKIRSDHRSLFLRLTIGQVNVRVWTQKDKERMKEEYNKFKWRTSFMFVLLPMFQLFVATNSTTQIIHTLYLMYYYSSLALRENVLRVNGSHIDAWWIFHHYISIGMSVVTVTMPNHLLGLYFRDGIFKFFLFQGGVMLLQNLYQSRRHYTRVATGKASPIDVAAGETLVETPREFLALIPLLFLTYLAELVVGGHFMFNTCTMNGQCHWQVAANGVLWTFMGVGNSLAVYRVLQKKARSKSVRHLHTKRN